jgi:hypothetical protein
VNPALLFLVVRTFVHGWRSRIARLKNPRYLVPFLLGIAYFGMLVIGPWRDGREIASVDRPGDARRAALLAEWIGAGIALLFVASSWLLPSRRSPLAFLEAEVSMLFPAPLTRRELVAYKVLDVQKVLLLSSLLIGALALLRSGPMRAATVFSSTWLFFGILSLHSIGANLTRRSLLDHGLAGWKRMGIPVAAILGLGAVVVFGAPTLPSFESTGRLQPDAVESSVFEWLEALGESPAGWALLPFRLLGRPMLAPDLPTFLLSAAMLVPLAVLLYLWVVRTDAAFEEAAAEQAVTLGRQIEAMRSGKGWRMSLDGTRPVRRAPWRLGASGGPEGAFAWKSAAESVRTFSPRLFGFLVAALAIGYVVARDMAPDDKRGAIGMIAGGVCLGIAGLLVFGGPSVLGSSLRQDMEQVEFLRTLPLDAARLVRCSLVGAIVPTALLQAMLVVIAACVMPQPRTGEITLAWRIAGAGALLAVLPAAAAVSALSDAAGVLWFPAWIRPGQAPTQGPEAMGYGIVLMLGKAALLLAGMLVPGIVATVVIVVARVAAPPAMLPSAVFLAGIAAAALVALELWLASFVLGARFQRLDAAEEGILS